MDLRDISSPSALLRNLQGELAHATALSEYEAWWEREGKAISAAHDRAGTPWLKMFNVFGKRIDEVQCAPEYWKMLREGYTTGVIWRAMKEQSLKSSFRLGYICSFYDAGLFCPYTVSLSTLLPLSKYGTEDVKARFISNMLREDETAWQGATWMTEAGGGSDLGSYVETVARREGDHWMLSGDKYFTSNAVADVAVVAARPEGAPKGVRGLALYLVPKRRENGELNYGIRRIKDKIATRSVFTGEIELRNSEGYLLGNPEHGIYHILEVLNCSRVCNAIGSVGLMQRALADAIAFAQGRVAFSKPICEHPLLRQQIQERIVALEEAHALAWESVLLFDEVWKETPPYSDRFNLFRIVVHLAKYWTAELAVQTAKWCMEVHGGMGTLAEYGVERWLREAMILAIWEGPPHRQILDGIEAMERKGAHRLLFEHLAPGAEGRELGEMVRRVESHLTLPTDQREAHSEPIFRDLARFAGKALAQKMR
ncbi:MAG: acyl-CoA dehydrogenase family protein [Candidatus Hydrogenedentes bacterium]|nr:acyl-CoA dehydrogenase family protein [Candidatus Hydrogenedentota bacterium]